MNAIKIAFVLTLMTVLAVFVGAKMGGYSGMVWGLAAAVAMNFGSYFLSDRIALAANGARPTTREQLPRVYAIVERLAQHAGLPMPKIYVIPTDSPNAFATGRNPQHASVAVTQGILSILDDEELEGVLAHELGHVRNYDILISSIVATLAGAITLIARLEFWFGGRDEDSRGGGLLMVLLAPVAAMLIQLAVSRSREYEADATGARLTHNPYALARALQKLELVSKRIPMTAPATSAHLFIVPPLNLANLFSTHPPTHKRVERLTGRAPEYQ